MYCGGGGGGGGYYGGGGGGSDGAGYAAGGGGGSSYSSGSDTIHTQGYQSGNGYIVITTNLAGSEPTLIPICLKKILGDADCDGAVTLKDYFYYVAKKAGVALPTSINVDFNASGAVDDADRQIVVKTLKP